MPKARYRFGFLLLASLSLALAFLVQCQHRVTTPTSAPEVGKEYHSPGTKGGPMVFVPAGEFWMGCNEQVDNECMHDEKPYHKVYLDAFSIDKFEVTQGEYSECVKAGKRKGGCQDNTKYDGFTGDSQPVVGVTWDQAKAFCEWAGKHLPTEAQWEKAARGTDGRKYPWGNTFDGTKLNFCDKNCDSFWADKNVDDGYAKTAPVGSYPNGSSPYGALDMAGNAWEWVADWCGEKYSSSSPDKNPTGPSSGTNRVLRGGCWTFEPQFVRASDRNNIVPAYRDDLWGFRCARDGS
jgi:eukaryotic-like serine/threonine-protein kinase